MTFEDPILAFLIAPIIIFLTLIIYKFQGIDKIDNESSPQNE